MRREKAALPYRREPPPVDRSKPTQNAEFNLPDEDRKLRILWSHRCPTCDAGPELVRWQGLDMRQKYAVRCPRCNFTTEPCPDSKKAIQLWIVTSKMIRS